MTWLKSQLHGSKAAWKVMANEVVIMPRGSSAAPSFGTTVARLPAGARGL